MLKTRTNPPAFEDTTYVHVYVTVCQLAETFVIPILTFLGQGGGVLSTAHRISWVSRPRFTLFVSGFYGTVAPKNASTILAIRRILKKKIIF